MNKSLLKRMGQLARCIAVLSIFFVLPPLMAGSLFAQNVSVSGVVKDATTGQPVVGAAVMVQEAPTIGTTTDEQGKYTIKVPGTNNSLIFDLVGYKQKVVKVGTQTTLNVSLDPDVTNLDEIVMIGYQSQKKRNVSAAISSISAEEIQDIPAVSLESLMQGRVSGVNIQNISGEAGVSPTFTVRGNTNLSSSQDGYSPNILSSPLYVIDGVIMPQDNLEDNYNYGTGTSVIAGINVNDIETIDVLKDASAAAIYGSRGANGVVIIKTKRGQTGKPKISLTARVGVQLRPTLADVYGGAAERRFKLNEIEYWAYNTPGSDPNVTAYQRIRDIPIAMLDSLNPYFNNSNDWQNIYIRTGIEQKYDMTISGGNEVASYRLGVGVYDEKGSIIGTGFSRYTFTDAQDWRFGKQLQVRTNLSYTHMNRPRGAGTDVGQAMQNLGMDMSPSYFYASATDIAAKKAEYEDNVDKNINNNFNGNITFIYNPWEIVQLNLQVTGYLGWTSRQTFKSSVLTGGDSQASQYDTYSRGFSIEPYISVSPTFGKHFINVLLGGSIDGNRYNSIYSYGHGAPNDAIQLVQAVAQENMNTSTDYNSSAMTSVWGRINYEYDNKYIVSATMRADASSKFMPDNQWGYFPSVSAAWIVTDEPFMKPMNKWLSMWKLRASYGKAGEQIIDNPYLRYSTYDVTGRLYWSESNLTYGGDVSIIPAYTTAIPQKDLSWKETNQFDIGTDIGILDEDLWIELDYYNKQTKGSPWNVDLPVYYGYTKSMMNAIDINNRGMELTIKSRNFKKTQVKWDTQLILSYNRNTVTALPDGGRDIIIDDEAGSRFSVGYPSYPFRRIKTDGIFDYVEQIPVSPYTGRTWYQDGGWTSYPGWLNMVDQNDNYYCDADDYQIVGDPNPKWTGSLNNTISWKNLSLNIYCIFTLDRDIVDGTVHSKYVFVGTGELNGKGAYYYKDNYFWRKPGDGGTTSPDETPSWSKAKVIFPITSPYTRGYPLWASRDIFIKDGSYFKISSMTLNYNLPQTWLKKVGIPRARIYATLSNIYTFKSSDILVPDPEQVNALGSYTGTSYPASKKLVFGLNIDF